MRLKSIPLIFVLSLTACQTAERDTLSTLFTTAPELSAADIMHRAQEAAGGETWIRPESLAMKGYAVFYKNGVSVKNEAHNMWRVYDRDKKDAHKADGKVRIESLRGGTPFFDVSFDGETTYTQDGPQAPSSADAQWASAFGFGIGRHAFDPGYTLARLPDDLVDGQPVYTVKITAPTGGYTNFWIAQDNAAILKIGFDTARGWHERIYSNFFTNPNVSWTQPGRVRLYYNGVKSNEVIWQSFAINQGLDDCLFVLPETEECRN